MSVLIYPKRGNPIGPQSGLIVKAFAACHSCVRQIIRCDDKETVQPSSSCNQSSGGGKYE